MELHEEKAGEVLLLAPEERLDSTTAPEFENQLLGAIEAGEKFLLLDFAGVDYMNSAGLKALLVAAKKLSSAKGKLVLCCLAPNVYTVFQLTGFHQLFTIKENRVEALAAFP